MAGREVQPVFVDVDFHNMAMAHDQILSSVTENTAAVFLTHVLGLNALNSNLARELESRHILLIEDVCESHGTMTEDRKAGTIGFASNFSFYYAHHMSTIEGGMICTNDKEFYSLCRMFRSHGMLRECDDEKLKTEVCQEYPELHPEFIFTVPGFNMRSTELNAVIGLSALNRLDKNIEKRRENFSLFLSHLDPGKYFTDFDTEGNSNYAFVIILREAYKNRYDALTSLLKDNGVEFRRGTAGGGNLVRQPFVSKRYPELNPEEYPNADYIHFYGIYTGNYPDLPKETILELCDLLNSI